MEHRPSIVMKLGSEKCQVGLSCDSAPRASIRTLVGRPNVERLFFGYTRGVELRSHYVGEEAELKESLLNVRRPMRRGHVDSWDDMNLIWLHAFRDVLRVNPEEHPVLLSEQLLVPLINREKMTQMLFETFKVPKMYVAQQPLLTLLSVGRTQGLVLDSGLEATYAVPIHDGLVVHEGVRRVDIGGLDLSTYMSHLLKEKDFTTRFSHQLVHNLCFVASDLQLELNNPALQTTYQLPDGQVVTVGAERVLVPEGFFNTSLLGSEAMGLPQLVTEAVKACKSEIQPSIVREVILSGGPCQLPGLASRLEMELERRLGGVEVDVKGTERGMRPSAWLGGAIFAELPGFQDMWISKDEYDEHGPSVVHRKCDIV